MEGKDAFLFCSWLASGRQSALSDYLVGGCTSRGLIHLCVSPSNAGVSYFRASEDLQVSQVTRPPPCPQGGRVQNHLTLCLVLFCFYFVLESPENLHSEMPIGTNPRSLPCANRGEGPMSRQHFLRESANPFGTFPQTTQIKEKNSDP